MTANRTQATTVATRANVVVNLPTGEHEAVIEALLSAGFGVA